MLDIYFGAKVLGGIICYGLLALFLLFLGVEAIVVKIKSKKRRNKKGEDND